MGPASTLFCSVNARASSVLVVTCVWFNPIFKLYDFVFGFRLSHVFPPRSSLLLTFYAGPGESNRISLLLFFFFRDPFYIALTGDLSDKMLRGTLLLGTLLFFLLSLLLFCCSLLRDLKILGAWNKNKRQEYDVQQARQAETKRKEVWVSSRI